MNSKDKKDKDFKMQKNGKGKKTGNSGKKVLSGMLFAAACFVAIFVLLEFHKVYWVVAIACVFLMAAAFWFLDNMFEGKDDIFDELAKAQEEQEKASEKAKAEAKEEDKRKADEEFRRKIEEQVASLDKTSRAMFAAMKRTADAQEDHMTKMQFKIDKVIIEQNAGVKTMIKFNKENARQMALSEKATLEEIATRIPVAGRNVVMAPEVPDVYVSEEETTDTPVDLASEIDAMAAEEAAPEIVIPEDIVATEPVVAEEVVSDIVIPEDIVSEEPAADVFIDEPVIEEAKVEDVVTEDVIPDIVIPEDIVAEEPAADIAIEEQPVVEEAAAEETVDTDMPSLDELLAAESAAEDPAAEEAGGHGFNEQIDPLAEILAGMPKDEPIPADEPESFPIPEPASEPVPEPAPAPAAETAPAPAPAPEPEKKAEEKPSGGIDLSASGVDLSDPNANLSAEDIAKLFAAINN
jgi:hypothetical protein